MMSERCRYNLAFRLVAGSVAIATLNGTVAAADLNSAAVEFFEKKIRPIFVEYCYKCHSAQAEELKGGLRLDTAEGLRAGGESGPVIVAGDPQRSRLIRAVRYLDPQLQMPPKKKLPDSVIADLETWIAMGAPDPRTGPAPGPPHESREAAAAIDYEKGRTFWSFQPVRDPHPPAVRNEQWITSPVDRFILAALEERGLSPASSADKRTLIRRATFDLTGLPPTPREISEFLSDDSPDAFAKVIERLLASPAYGERWGRHWLDVVRYADSKDERFMNQDVDLVHIWRYRDWVVSAFNRDYPYDQFVVDQIAGDILSARSPIGLDLDRLVATGMLAVGNWEWGDADKRKMMTDIVDDQIDVIGRGILGLTIACARCHDHKFDPISTKDYYALAGFFFSSHVIPEPNQPALPTAMLSVPALTRQQAADRKNLQEREARVQASIAAILERHKQSIAQSIRQRSADYLIAAYDHARSLNAASELAVESLATERGLDATMLHKFLAYLGLPDGSGAHVAGLFGGRFDEVVGQKGFYGWGEVSTPWVIINPADQPRKVTSISFPARSIVVHPAPDRPVSIGWRSPVSGTIAIRGHVRDADGTCGNGIVWRMEHSRARSRRVLLSGTVDNGGAGELSAESLRTLEVQHGDLISLTVDPRDGELSCDSTVVDLIIELLDGSGRSWNLASDWMVEPHRENPRADRWGHPGVWNLFAWPAGAGAGGLPAHSTVARWLRAVGEEADRLTIERLAGEVQRTALADTPGEADAPSHQLLRSAEGFFLRGVDFAATLDAESTAELRSLQQELADVKQALAAPVIKLNAVQEGGVPRSEHEGIRDARVHVRGRYDRLGEIVPRGFPRVLLPPLPQGEGTGEGEPSEYTVQIPANTSGRLELAHWIADPAHPLTARVMVNRIWQHHFGRGIVATAENFGQLGARPIHPELLDWLACRFIESGWSVKAMHRLIMLSSTYRQSSRGSPELVEADPENLLLGRTNRRRLEVEALRDALLALSGRLDPTMGGPPVRDISIPRRTLYITTTRSDASTFRELFDGPDPTAIITRRNESTVAPQSLFMLNHPFVDEQTRAIAGQLLGFQESDVQRMRRVFEWLYARPPTAQEAAAGLEVLANLNADAPIETWTRFVQVLICANEFMYVD